MATTSILDGAATIVETYPNLTTDQDRDIETGLDDIHIRTAPLGH